MTKFSSEEKLQAVRQYLDGNEGVKSIAKSTRCNHAVYSISGLNNMNYHGDECF